MPLLIWPILTGIGAWLLRGLLAAGVIKFAASVFLFFSLEFLVANVLGVMPPWFSPSALSNSLSAITSVIPTLNGIDIAGGIWYFAGMSSVKFGIVTVLNAYITRFTIRRIFK